MNFFEFVINLALIAVVITAMGVGGGVLISYFRSREKQARALTPELVAKLEHVDQLEQRVRVLEQVITDSRHRLKDQFDALERTAL